MCEVWYIHYGLQNNIQIIFFFSVRFTLLRLGIYRRPNYKFNTALRRGLIRLKLDAGDAEIVQQDLIFGYLFFEVL